MLATVYGIKAKNCKTAIVELAPAMREQLGEAEVAKARSQALDAVKKGKLSVRGQKADLVTKVKTPGCVSTNRYDLLKIRGSWRVDNLDTSFECSP
jgi:hypothetical protein